MSNDIQDPFGAATQVEGDKPPVIELRNVSKSFRNDGKEITILKDFNLTVPDVSHGEFVAILGPSGCGKSTVMNLVAGMSSATSGEVFSYGRKIDGDNRDAVTVQQAYTCLPWRSVIKNIEFGLEIRGVAAGERRTIAEEYLEKVGMKDRANAFPRELSGGMQQRVAIARCLALKPKVMLMDEPFGALDAKIREDMQKLLLNLWSAEKNCILFITHDITEALLLADRIVVMAGRPAQIAADMIVPFGRPRVGDGAIRQNLASSPEFLAMSQQILGILKGQGGSGQVRVSI